MSLSSVTGAYYREQQQLAADYRTEALAAWRRVDRRQIADSWRMQLPRLMLLLTTAQLAAATAADTYVTNVLNAQRIDPTADGHVRPHALTGIASDGRPLDTLLELPSIVALTAIGKGVRIAPAMSLGQGLVDMIARTQVADAGRVAVGLSTVARRHATGYIRMLTSPSCSRCIVLAGRWYRQLAAFLRHPKCDCRNIPGREDVTGDHRTDPRATFDGMSRAEQDKVFTRDGAQAIRDGADINRVVNARRGAAGLSPAGKRLTAAEIQELRGGTERGRLTAQNVFGRQLFTTTEGKGPKRGGPRLMPESIYQIATDRDDALRLLRLHGYII